MNVDERLKNMAKKLNTDFNGVTVNFITHNRYTVDFINNQLDVHFQNGPITEDGPNGITNESLLVILKHRINELNKINPCMANIDCLHYLNKAEIALEERTRDRLIRNVEGTNLS